MPRKCQKGSKVDLVQQESPPDLDTENVNKELDLLNWEVFLIPGNQKRALSLLRLKGRMLKSKQTQVQRLPSPYTLSSV